MKRLIFATALAFCAGLASVQAQTYPARSITLIVPFPPGGSTDVVAHIMAERMRPLLGQPVIIENVGGAGGSIAVGRVARAAPDGYTIDIGQWDTHVGSVIYPITYDLQKDFEPIGLISINPQLMVGKKALPADDLKGLVAWMKANPGEAKFVNQNAAAQVTGILLQQSTGTRVQFIPYRGAGPAMQDLLAGHLDLLVVQAAAALPQVRAGAIKAIANLSPRRSQAVPDIPTSDEGGVPGLYMSGRFGFFAPKGTPKDVIARLNDAMVQTLAEPAVRAPVRRSRTRCRGARAADARGTCGVPQGRDREVVADHQGSRHQGGVKRASPPLIWRNGRSRSSVIKPTRLASLADRFRGADDFDSAAGASTRGRAEDARAELFDPGCREHRDQRVAGALAPRQARSPPERMANRRSKRRLSLLTTRYALQSA
jgi:tripartite-type tricarboxylate transporter receptor subunit TctC